DPAQLLGNPLPRRRQHATAGGRPVPAPPKPLLRPLPHSLPAQHPGKSHHLLGTRPPVQPRNPRHPATRPPPPTSRIALGLPRPSRHDSPTWRGGHVHFAGHPRI